ETFTVPINTQPGHIPAAEIGITNAEDNKGGLRDGIARTPEERQGAMLRVDISRRIPAEHAVISPFNGPARFSVGAGDAGLGAFDLISKIRLCFTGGDVGGEIFFGTDVEDQLRDVCMCDACVQVECGAYTQNVFDDLLR